MITTVLFDLYGTLIQLKRDTRPYHKLVRQNPTPDRCELLRKSLIHSCESLSDFAELIGLPVPKEIDLLESDLKQDIESAALFEDSLPTLTELKEQGIKTALISNAASPYKLPVRTLGLKKYFDAIIFSCDVGVAKPSASIYRLALEQLGSSPAEAVMVGDSYKSDVRGPENVGITGIHLLRSDTHNKPNKISELSKVVLEVYR
jgi:FMN phosphatase YigB (HAD superfamily)